MHAGTKVLAVVLVAFAVLLHGRFPGLALTGGLVMAGMAAVPGARGSFLALARRLRWVLLFILVLHGWFTPGTPVLGEAGSWLPTREGLLRGGELLGVVAVMAGLVAVLVQSTPGMDLAVGLAWVLSPLGALGLSVTRFGRLLAWTLDRVEPVRREAGAVRDALRLRRMPAGGPRGRLSLEVAVARMVLRRAREAADRNAEALYLRRVAEAKGPGRPGRADWILLMAAALWLGLLMVL